MSIRGLRGLVCTLGIWGLVLPACGNGDDGNDNQGETAGRGSAACNKWQSALCGWASRCQSGSAVQLCNQAKGITCQNNAAAEACSSSLASSACTEFPTGCQPLDQANPAPAQAACNGFLEAVCRRQDECMPGSFDSCLTQLRGMVNCSLAVGFQLGYEECLAQIGALACDASDLPAICEDVLTLRPS
jgi:hypothetical protein